MKSIYTDLCNAAWNGVPTKPLQRERAATLSHAITTQEFEAAVEGIAYTPQTYGTMRLNTGICLLFILSFLFARPIHARIVRVMVNDKAGDPWPLEGKSFGSVGTYRRIQGVLYGELDAADPHNRIIQDISLAKRNEHGRVQYASTFTLYLPSDMTKWTGVLVYEIVNRGAAILPDRFETGDAFLVSGWQADIPFGGRSIYGLPAETIRVPMAQNTDGTSVTGPVLARFVNIVEGTKTLPIQSAIGYVTSGPPPVPQDLEASHARLRTYTFEDVAGFRSAPATIAASDWSWGDCTSAPFPGKPDASRICLKGGFDSTLLYELTYTGKDPLVMGIGFAAMRDAVAFFRSARKDDGDFSNPFTGRAMHTVARGASQSGNALRTFLNLGFNEDESGHKVFDGAMSLIAARQVPLNVRFGVPGGASSMQELGSDGTLWWEHWPDTARGLPASGLLDRCHASHTCPKIVEVLGSSEFWSLRASPDFVGTSADRDIPLPADVRRYYIASVQHGGGIGGFRVEAAAAPAQRAPTIANPIVSASCGLPLNPNPTHAIEDALLADLEAWVTTNQEPPSSKYPSLANGMLVPANALSMGFPRIPQLPQPDGVANPIPVYDLGTAFAYNDLSGAVEKRPSPICKVISPLVPRTDADGNELAGIHTVLQQAALGTYLGWNVTARGFYKGQYCSLAGGYVPFAHTRDERQQSGDSRLSLEERYGTQRGYTCVATRAAEQLLRDRFLLPDDARSFTMQATASGVLPSDDESTPANRRRADEVCGTR